MAGAPEREVNVASAFTGELIASFQVPVTSTILDIKQLIEGETGITRYCQGILDSNDLELPEDTVLIALLDPVNLQLIKVP